METYGSGSTGRGAPVGGGAARPPATTSRPPPRVAAAPPAARASATTPAAVLSVGLLPPPGSDAGVGTKACDPRPAVRPLGKGERGLSFVGIADGAWATDWRTEDERSPVTDALVWRNRTGVVYDQKRWPNKDAARAFPRFLAVVYDSLTRQFRSLFHDDRAACEDFVRACGVRPGSMAKYEGMKPTEEQITWLAAVRPTPPFLFGSPGVPGNQRDGMVKCDALMKNGPLTVGATEWAHLDRTFGRAPHAPLRGVYVSGVARAGDHRAAGIRFCLATAKARGRDCVAWCPAGEVEETRAALGMEPRPLAGPGADASMRAMATRGELAGWCHGAADQDVALRQAAFGGQAGTAAAFLALEARLVRALGSMTSVPLAPGCDRRVAVWVDLATARGLARNAEGSIRTYGQKGAQLALLRLAKAVSRVPTSDHLDRFNNYDARALSRTDSGLSWMAAAATAAEARKVPHVMAMIEVRAARVALAELGVPAQAALVEAVEAMASA